MCGIAGWFKISNLKTDSLVKMLDRLKHRGPDGKALYSDGLFFGGMVRLAVNGLSNGKQPLFSFSGKIILLYNGEIYNSPALRESLKSKGVKFKTDSDGEVLCHLFELEGSKCFKKIDGMFAAALWNTETKVLTLVRDLPGEKPLYYANHPSGGMVFASEIKAFAGLQQMGFTLNKQAIADLPTFLWVPEPNTIFTEIKALPRGNFLEVSQKLKPRLTSYHPKSTLSTFTSEKEAAHEIRKICDASIDARLLSEVKVGAFLSGGLDSSIIAVQAAKKLSSLTTFCIGFEKANDPYHGMTDESTAAEETAKFIGSTHHTIRVSAFDFRNSLESFCKYGDQPFAVSSGLGILQIAQKAKSEGIKVMLSGDGADEYFGGYSWYEYLAVKYQHSKANSNQPILFAHDTGLTVEKRLEAISHLAGSERARAWHYYASEVDKKKLFSRDFLYNLKSSTRIFSKWKNDMQWSALDFISNDRDCYLPNEMLRKVDRMTMAHSVEGRTPFTSPSVMALATRIPYSMMRNGRILKSTLRKAYSDTLPRPVLERPKHGFNIPIDLWLKNDWRDLVMDAFSKESALSKHGIISNKSQEEALKMLHSSKRLNGHTLFSFIMLNMWLEQEYGNYC
jgi:asparagine synthase (glutamine-hydrolysing)